MLKPKSTNATRARCKRASERDGKKKGASNIGQMLGRVLGVRASEFGLRFRVFGLEFGLRFSVCSLGVLDRRFRAYGRVTSGY